MLACVFVTLTDHAHAARPPANSPGARLLALASIDPRTGDGLRRIALEAEALANTPSAESDADRMRSEPATLRNLPAAELPKVFAVDPAVINPAEIRAVATLGKLARVALENEGGGVRSLVIEQILEIQAALITAREPVVPEKLGPLNTWQLVMRNRQRRVGTGTLIATNLAGEVPPEGDFGRLDPRPSTFWTAPSDFAGQDLYTGFGRSRFGDISNAVGEYDEPKTSFGTTPGFEMVCDDVRYKIKFGEINSEPFTARIFFALGYHVDPTDYAPAIRIRYDRRLFREFHLRRPLTMRVVVLGVPFMAIQLQRRYDPFQYVTRVVFKDGRELSGAEFEQILFADPTPAHPEDSPENFRPEIEAAVDHLVLAPANVQPRDRPMQNIGSWQFGGLGHEHRREVRGLTLLSAWLAFFDIRPDNTKLRIPRGHEPIRLEHFISDLGGGRRSVTGWFSPRGEDPNTLAWTFTRPEILRGSGRMTTPFRIEDYKPIMPAPAFGEMTVDDARWMARQIGRLTEDQLRGALIASGYDAAQTKLYLDLNLAGEIPLLRPEGMDRVFSYDPVREELPAINLADGRRITARATDYVVVQGRLVRR
jgi:hypothetical protein